MFGEAARNMTLQMISEYRGFLLAVLPPGAFMGLGLLIAIKNMIDAHRERRRNKKHALAFKEINA
jgi:electron transport complex protein RnfE